MVSALLVRPSDQDHQEKQKMDVGQIPPLISKMTVDNNCFTVLCTRSSDGTPIPIDLFVKLRAKVVENFH